MRPDKHRELVVGPDTGPEAPFPLRLNGKVVKGFGRGSKEVGMKFPISADALFVVVVVVLSLSGSLLSPCSKYGSPVGRRAFLRG